MEEITFTKNQSKFFAHELTKRCPPDSVEKLAGAVASAQVDLNPHQVDAALFAFPLGLYELPRRSGDAHLYRLNHPLAEALLAQAKDRHLPPAESRLHYGPHDGKVSQLEPFIGISGWLTLSLFSVESLGQAEDHLIIAASADAGEMLEEGVAARLLTLPGDVTGQLQGSRRLLIWTI